MGVPAVAVAGDDLAGLELLGFLHGLVGLHALGERDFDGVVVPAELTVLFRRGLARAEKAAACEHLENRAAQAPHVHGCAQWRTDDEFRRHVFARAEGRALLEAIVGASEIGEPRGAGAGVVDDVVGLDVRVRVAAAVQALDGAQELPCHALHAGEFQRTSAERVVEAASVLFVCHADVAVVEECLAQSDDLLAFAEFAADELVQRHLEDGPLAVAAACVFLLNRQAECSARSRFLIIFRYRQQKMRTTFRASHGFFVTD